MMFESYYCICCGLHKLKSFMHDFSEEIGICNSCYSEIMTTKDMTFEEKEYVDAVIAPFLYEGIMSDTIKEFKFGGQKKFGEYLTLLGYKQLENKSLLEGYDLIVPVPLHKNRFSERGFNQAEILAEALSKEIGIGVDSVSLIRTRDTLHQSSLKGRDRIENVRDAFAANTDFTGKKIILTDDIYTMGETANECAKALKRAGAERVAVFAICKRVMKQKSSLF